MGRWQTRLLVFGFLLMASGAGLLVGYMLVRVPMRWDVASMQAPSWLFWAGAGCILTGVVSAAVARSTSPPYESAADTTETRPKPVRKVTLPQFGCFLTFVGALVVCSVAASSSEYRWRPLWATLLIFGLGVPVGLLLSRRHT